MNHFARTVVMLAAISSAAGCGDNDPRTIQISGTATFNGEPIPFGQILFEPDAALGHAGPAGFALITDGKFNTRLSGKGIASRGAYVVRIHGQTARLTERADKILPLFNPYEVRIEITDPTQNFDVPQSAAKNLLVGPPI